MIAILVATIVIVLAFWAAALVFQPSLWWIPLALTVVAALAWGGYFLWRHRKRRVNAKDIEHGLGGKKAAADAGEAPEDSGSSRRGDTEGLNSEFSKAIKALKSSKLAHGGADALAVLPWYLIVGPSGVGKSSALRASGLRFPYLSKRGGVKGTGGTRNCEWWLTNEAVLIDTAGRYATGEDDREEWFEFLNLMARTRPEKPVNGVLVAVSVPDLKGPSEEAAGDLGRQMRERVDELMGRLQLVLPVYVLVTKCDLLPGFVETFGSLRKQERGQVWGFTLPLKDKGERTEACGEAFDELVECLEERALRRMGEERQTRAREQILALPEEFASLRPNLSAFLEALVAENVYQDAPILRGCYFTSSTQETSAIDRAKDAIVRECKLEDRLAGQGAAPFDDGESAAPGAAQEAPAQPRGESKSYFLTDVFAKVIFPDQTIAFRNAKAVQKDRIRRWALAGAVAAVALAFLFFPVRSYLSNRDLMARAGQAADEVVARLGSRGYDSGPPSLQALEPLRGLVEQLLDHAERGRPLALGFGMYRGDVLLPALERLYGTAVRRSLVDPVVQRDLSGMAGIVARMEAGDTKGLGTDPGRLYEMLKLHLLLAPMPGEGRLGPERQRFVAEAIADRWGTRSEDDTFRKNAQLYARLLAQDERLGVTRDQVLVSRARKVLAKAPFAQLALDNLVNAAELRDRDLTLPGMLGGTTSVLAARTKVRGAFTRRAYDEFMKGRLDDPGKILEPWVLAGDEAEGEARLKSELEDLRSLYYERYIQEWRAFLDSLSLQLPGGLAAALEELTRGPRTPLARLFQALAENTQIGGNTEEVHRAAEGLGKRVLNAVGLSGQEDRARTVLANVAPQRRLGPADVEKEFASLVEFGYAPRSEKAQRTPLDLYEEQLGFMREALQRAAEGGDPGALSAKALEASAKIQPLIDAREGWRPLLTALLMSPVSLGRQRGEHDRLAPVAQGWCGTVAPAFRKTIADHYPFARSGDDAALADVTEFFRPGGVLWGFYDASLRPMVVRSSSGFAFVTAGGRPPLRGDLLSFLASAQEASTALFPASGSAGPSVAFSVRVRPTPRVAAVFLEVDGQRIEYRNGPEEWRPLTWPGGSPGATLRVRTADGREETLHRDGEWGFFRLLEAGALRGEASGREFGLSWNLPGLGLTVTADFRAARAESPFFGVKRRSGRLFEPLRAVLNAPHDILLGGRGCP